MPNKLILFDWGNIVESHTTGFSCSDAFKETFKKCGYKGKRDIFHSLGKYKLSSIKNQEEFANIYELMKKEFKFNTSYEEFVNIYKEVFSKIDYYQDVADYEVSLKDRCKIGIFSNLTIFDKERLDKQVKLKNYDYVFLSFEFGLRKPEIELYNIIQSRLPFQPKDILFIDDRTDNIESAKKVGWNTFQITGLELDKIKEKCEEFLNN